MKRNKIIAGVNFAVIELTQNKTTIIDLEDLGRVQDYTWCAARRGRDWYALTNIDGHTVLMHRFLLGLRPGDKRQVDHIYGHTLDNRRSASIRVVSASGNSQNHHHASGISNFMGVDFHKARGKWRAQICLNDKGNKTSGTKQHLGLFDSEEGAAIAYLQARDALGRPLPNYTQELRDRLMAYGYIMPTKSKAELRVVS